ncbi:YbaY family lipoprotein [Sodalis-like endosymbiont of Proechinophthirus fluctus]|uniref:YbaY family lipoprotein n=1 Tax=Sodalis-like endosymbiont of Proechinophthirus fluctus TaxID=1462730 RepID=UPI001FCBC0A6|nr:YbaY family lipoprotein [Sodalis-like endosymbiont of Proechinophthirus fluctus]
MYIRKRITLAPNTALTLSNITIYDTSSKVIAQRVAHTDGKQAGPVQLFVDV